MCMQCVHVHVMCMQRAVCVCAWARYRDELAGLLRPELSIPEYRVQVEGGEEEVLLVVRRMNAE